MTGKNRRIASCLYFMSFVQAAGGIGASVYYALHHSTISSPAFRSKLLRKTRISKVPVFPDIHFDEYRACYFQAWKTGEVIYFTLSFVYGAFFPSSTAHTLVSDPFSVKDTMALLIIVYFAKRRYGGLARVSGVPSLLYKILQDATTYFLVLSTGHLLLLFFEVFPPVSGPPVDSCSTTYDKIT